MKLYVYDVDTQTVTAIITGDEQSLLDYIETLDTDTQGATFTPAFGFIGGLELGANIEEITI